MYHSNNESVYKTSISISTIIDKLVTRLPYKSTRLDDQLCFPLNLCRTRLDRSVISVAGQKSTNKHRKISVV